MNEATFLRKPTKIIFDFINLIEVSGYHSQYLRPNTTTMTDSVISEVEDLVTRFGGNIPTNAITNLTNKFMLPKATPEYVSSYGNEYLDVNIPYGWDEKRFVFIMKVRTISNNIEKTEIITGYTDFSDYIKKNNGEVDIDGMTKFFINGISTVSTRTINNDVKIFMLRDNFSVFGGGGLDSSAYKNKTTKIMSPGNMLYSSQINGIDGLTDILDDDDGVIVSDFKNVSNIPTLSYRNNNSPTSMVSKVINSYANKVELLSNNSNMDEDTVYYQARGSVSDPGIFNSSFLTALSNIFGYSVSCFEFRDILRIDNTIDDRISVSFKNYKTSEFTSPWDKPTRETQMALITSNMVNTMMCNNSLVCIEFNATNMNSIGYLNNITYTRDQVEITNILGFNNNLNYRGLIDSLCVVIAEELCVIVSNNGEIPYHLSVSCDINTDITVTISFDGYNGETFVFPSFADSLLSPILTTDSDLYRKNSRDIGVALETVHDKLLNNRFYNEYNSVNDEMGHLMIGNEGSRYDLDQHRYNQNSDYNHHGFINKTNKY